MTEEVLYYLMRHADYYSQKNEYISYHGMLSLKLHVDRLKAELDEKFPGKSLKIIHSELPRVQHTALLMQEMLSGMNVVSKSDPTLNVNKLGINNAYITTQVTECHTNNQVCLLLSHEPDIKFFAKKELVNSQIISQTIPIEVKDPTVGSDDDLPF